MVFRRLVFGPAKALFSVIGVYIIVGILWLVALYLMAPALIARLRIFLKRNISETRTRMADRAEAKRAAALLEEKPKLKKKLKETYGRWKQKKFLSQVNPCLKKIQLPTFPKFL